MIVDDDADDNGGRWSGGGGACNMAIDVSEIGEKGGDDCEDTAWDAALLVAVGAVDGVIMRLGEEDHGHSQTGGNNDDGET